MSRDIVIYDSTNGTTEETVNKIRNICNKDIKIIHVKDAGNIDISQYERVFIGSGIYGGNISNKLSEFIKHNSSTLDRKKIIFFVHSISSETKLGDTVKNSIKTLLKSGSFEIICLGGKVNMEKTNFFLKTLLKSMLKENNVDPNNPNTIVPKKVDELLAYFK